MSADGPPVRGDARSSESIAMLLTPPGRGAVAAVAYEGRLDLIDAEPPLFHAANGRALTAQALHAVCFGAWGRGRGHDAREDVVVCRVSPLRTEIHCHGGAAAVRRILADLAARGCRMAAWRDVERARRSLLELELDEALQRATTLRTAKLLLEQLQSRLLPRALTELRETTLASARPRLEEMLRWERFGLHLTQPWNVVLCGRPNVGKSSLINALLGYSRSIVYDQPGTTRDVVSGETALDGWPVELSDTAGLRDAAEGVEAAGIERARQRLASADLRVVVLDASQPVEEGDRELIARWPDALFVAHKSDLACAWDELPEGAIAASSKSGAGVEEVAREVVRRLVPEMPPAGMALMVNARQAECLRGAYAACVDGDEGALRRGIERWRG